MSKLIHRITMFKLEGADNQKQLLAAYEKLSKEQKKVWYNTQSPNSSSPKSLFPPSLIDTACSDKPEPLQDGKPYIVYLGAGLANPEDPRTKGYTVIAESKFKTIEDMKFYDDGCAAHQELRTVVKGLGPAEPPMTVYFEGTPVLDLTHA